MELKFILNKLLNLLAAKTFLKFASLAELSDVAIFFSSIKFTIKPSYLKTFIITTINILNPLLIQPQGRIKEY